MKMTNSKLDFTDLLAVAFIVLKLTKVIDWSWWWVLAPIWISFILAVLNKVADRILEKHKNMEDED